MADSHAEGAYLVRDVFDDAIRSRDRRRLGRVVDIELELSDDGRTWRRVVDHSAAGRDAPHDYEVLPKAVRARFVRLRNVRSPAAAR